MAIRVSELNTPAVEVDGISKRFGQAGRVRRLMPWRTVKPPKLALDQVCLHVDTGRITGILGANGSGKSTLIRILATLLTPDAGRASVFGYDVVTQAAEVRRHINRVSVEASFFKEMSPWENMLYAARLYGSGGEGTRGRVEAMQADEAAIAWPATEGGDRAQLPDLALPLADGRANHRPRPALEA